MSPLGRRLVTVPLVTALFWLVLVGFPLLVLVALVVDVLRGARTLGTTRMVAFLLSFLAIEQLGLWRLAIVGLTTRARSREREAKTFAVQRSYTGAHLTAVQRVFGVRFAVEGAELASGGPVVVFVRHASMVDSLVPGGFIANPHALELRYALKRELTVVPCLDIAGHWLPNHFVERSGSTSEREVAAVRALKTGLPPNAGVVVFPEGTRFSRRRREQALSRLEGEARAKAERLRHLLPIRRGGALALLDEAPACDVLFVGHHGLEGLTGPADIWRGSLVGRTITVKLWREKAATIPASEAERVQWLEERWQRLDDWLETFEVRT